LCVSFEFVDHGSCRSNTVQALDQWRHSVALSEALDVLHLVMHPASYRYITMTLEIANNLPAFIIVIVLLLPTTILS